MISVHHFFDAATSTLTYVVSDPSTKDAIVIDPVLDYDPGASTTSTKSIQAVADYCKAQNLKVLLILETHAHADHLSSAQHAKKKFWLNATVGIGENIRLVQQTFKKIFGLPDQFRTDGSQFDRLFKDNEVVTAGSLNFKVLFTPGHTPACASYLFDDAVFTGDALFMPDYGTGRCDFPGGSAESLYRSITERLFTLPDSTRVFTGHDYQPGGRDLQCESTIGEEKQKNIQLSAKTTAKEFLDFRTNRDKGLSAPKLLYPSVQFNIAGGKPTVVDPDGRAFLKIPLL